jgi:hypothetical protein
MNKPREILDLADTYDAHAYLISGFVCDGCGVNVLPDAGFEGCDDICCCHIADKAKTSGWQVISANGTCFCAACTQAHGL